MNRSDAPSRAQEHVGRRLIDHQQGSVEILCREIGFPWDARLERSEVLVAFVRELVREIADMRAVQEAIAPMGGKPPSEGSAHVMLLAEAMLAVDGDKARQGAASLVHEASRRLNPTDHLIDMLSSCASAIRFGLEKPCGSRHAADAAQHVWSRRYGVSLFDGCTGAWEKDWARQKLIQALISFLPAPDEPLASQKATLDCHEP